MAVGHIYYFLEDVFPTQRGGFKLIKTPGILKTLLDTVPEDPNYNPLPEEERPGGYEWGGEDQGAQNQGAQEGENQGQDQDQH